MPRTRIGTCDCCERKEVPTIYSNVCREWYCGTCFEYIAEKVL